MVKFNRPEATYETFLIYKFGIEFLKLDEISNTEEDLLLGYSKASPIMGDTTFSLENVENDMRAYEEEHRSTKQNKLFQSWKKKVKKIRKEFPQNNLVVSEVSRHTDNIFQSVRKYKDSELSIKILRDTLTNAKKMIYIATVEPEANTEELVSWINRTLRREDLETFSWQGPGDTLGVKKRIYHWENQENLDADARLVYEIFGIFQSELFELIIKSLNTRHNTVRFPEKNKIGYHFNQKISNGEFYFAACPSCRKIFSKGKYDKKSCSRTCSMRLLRKK